MVFETSIKKYVNRPLSLTAMATATTATMTFLKRDPRHKKEKPYEILYEMTDDTKRMNYDVNIVHDILVEDLRPQKGRLSLDRDGFMIEELKSAMPYEDFFDETKLKTQYAQELRQFLIQLLGARAIFFHECVVSPIIILAD